MPCNAIEEKRRDEKAIKRLGDYPGRPPPKRICNDPEQAERKLATESELMDRARRVLGIPAMNQDGGLIRTLIRQNSDRAERVLADLENAISEGRDIRTRFGYFIDAWKRFSKSTL